MMAFQPDIIVTGPDGVMLVVEAKVRLPNLELSEEQLKRYMSGMQCPTGVLITPEHIWVCRDLYTTRTPQSIQRIGEFDTKGLWQQPPPSEPMLFEDFVQRWLERLAQQPAQELPPNIRRTFREYVIPAVTNGELRAAHPRYF
jgi:hypothetical protein